METNKILCKKRSIIRNSILKSIFLLVLFFPICLISSAFPLAHAESLPYVASKSSDVYHMIECGHADKIDKANRIYFSSRTAAEKTGRRPCSYCGDDIVDHGTPSNSSSYADPAKKPTKTVSTAQSKQPNWGAIILFAYLGCSIVILPVIVTILSHRYPQKDFPVQLTIFSFLFFIPSIPVFLLIAFIEDKIEKRKQ